MVNTPLGKLANSRKFKNNSYVLSKKKEVINNVVNAVVTLPFKIPLSMSQPLLVQFSYIQTEISHLESTTS